MSKLDYSAGPLIVSLDICRVLERSIKELDDNVGADDGQYPSDLVPSSYERIEKALMEVGIDVNELNEKINKAIFGEDRCLKYYSCKKGVITSDNRSYEPPIGLSEEKDVINTCYYCHCKTKELTKYKGVWACIDCYNIFISIDLKYKETDNKDDI